MNFHTGKKYNFPSNFYFYKSNQPRLWMEYCKKVDPNTSSCIIFPENNDNSWVDMKKFL